MISRSDVRETLLLISPLPLPFASKMTEKEDIYCAEQIKIPSSFPYILKQYAKAAIRTQPYDLLQWTCAYFRALANSEIPPVKVNDLTFFFSSSPSSPSRDSFEAFLRSFRNENNFSFPVEGKKERSKEISGGKLACGVFNLWLVCLVGANADVTHFHIPIILQKG